MTKAQRIAHKKGNQKRKAAILKLMRTGLYPGWYFKPIQDGKYTAR